MQHFHVVVWIDHREARVFSLDAESGQRELKLHHHSAEHLHHKAGPISGSGKSAAPLELYEGAAKSLSEAGEILLIGPGTAKKEFAEYLRQHRPAIHAKVIGVETVDHPTDGEIVKIARQRFQALDRLAGP